MPHLGGVMEAKDSTYVSLDENFATDACINAYG
jgi:hypothetical protein